MCPSSELLLSLPSEKLHPTKPIDEHSQVVIVHPSVLQSYLHKNEPEVPFPGQMTQVGERALCFVERENSWMTHS